ncbi:hypothetical protein Zmor_004429 [Zophobas morio]|uniref:Uncharacterized protein n=1 Tax=Zophobas morio TaxID=2755281 RepID=A0AA38LZE3_9CUCU|nr:hypothetical protein Zmor_004429 [Zophobas morio]
MTSDGIIPLTQTDLSKYTYEDPDNGVGFGTQYYLDENGNYVPFYRVNNIVLQLPKEIELSDELNNDQVVSIDADGNKTIHPFN